MKLNIVTLALAGALLLAAGCSESHDEMPDAAIVFDAELPPPDSGPPPSNVGDACRGSMDCDVPAEECLEDLFGFLPFPDGYCSLFCDTEADCPDGSVCVSAGGGGGQCLRACEPGAPDQCRPGHGCADSMRLPAVCLPGCEDDTDCGDGATCVVGSGFTGAGQCIDLTAPLGGACTSSGDCAEGAFCASEDDSGFPGGACVTFGCDADGDTGCPDDAHCFPQRGPDICIDGCETDDDCRAGYACTTPEGAPDRAVCLPAFDPANLGQVCSGDPPRGPCTGGECLSEFETGYPDSYCVQSGCDPEAADTGCEGDGVCVATPDGVGRCLESCASATDCREGYDCAPSDPADASSALACVPGCDDSSVCGNDGFECNPGTGLCTEPFAEARLGEPCTSGEDCPGGRCLAEASDGWPAGTCSYPGCRLNGTGPGATCPSGGVCVDDGAGDPELGVCVDGCTVGGSDCRPGYACLPSAPTGPTACLPACGDGDCGPGTTCSATTGRCE